VRVLRARGDEQEDAGRDQHATDRGDGGDDRGLGVRQLAVDEFLLQLDRDEQEEDREQAVADPVRDRQVEAEGTERQVRVEQAFEAGADRGVRHDQAEHGGGEERDGAEAGGADEGRHGSPSRRVG